MTLKEAIDFIDDLKPNAFSSAVKTQWINEAEGMVQTQIILRRTEDIVTYSYAEDKQTELIARPPHDKLYVTYLAAMIDFANGEYDRYNNGMTLFNEHFGEFMRWYAKNYHPAGYGPRNPSEYLGGTT